MLSIGELAHRAGVSVRMPRHYDALGLIVPARVDEATGYRWYTAAQLGRVHTLSALRELGFPLEQCRILLDGGPSVAQLREMLRLRRAELHRRIDADTRRLAEVDQRLVGIEEGMAMTNETLRLQPLPALRLAQVRGTVREAGEIGALVAELASRLAGYDDGTVRTYYGHPDGTRIDVAVGILLGPDEPPAAGLELAELPAEPRGAVVTHRPDDAAPGDPWLTVDTALHARGMESFGVYRQLCLGDTDELQCPVRDATACG